MKNLVLVLGMILLISTTFAQGLNANASYIKKNYPIEYENILKKQALKKWGTNYEMVVYMINNQADALFGLIKSFKGENTNIAFEAIQKWSIDGYKASNIAAFKKIKTFGLKQLIPLHCNWEMVQYEYDNQVKAKNSF